MIKKFLSNLWLSLFFLPLFAFAQEIQTHQVISSPMVTIVPGSMPTTYPTLPQFNDTTAKTSVTILNEFNQDVNCTYQKGAGTPIPFNVPAGSAFTDNFATRGEVQNKGVSCIHPSSTPASGNLYIFGTTH